MSNKVEIRGFTTQYRQAGKPPAFVIAAPSQTFTDLDKEVIICSKDWFQKVPVTSAGNGIYNVAAFENDDFDNRLSATVWDGEDTGVVWTFTLTDANFKPLAVLYENIRIPDSFTSATLADLDRLSRGTRFFRPFLSYVTQTDFYAALANLVDLARKATRLIYGAVRLDTAPASASDPVAVGSNSPRIPLSLSVNFANDLEAAITAIGADVAELLIDDETDVSTAVVIPANIYLTAKNGVLNNDGGTIEFEGVGISKSVGRVELFRGFDEGDVRWTGLYPDEFYPEWFGAVADDTTDDLEAFNNLFASMRSPSTDYNRVRGGTVILAPTKYYLSDTLRITRTLTMRGTGGGDRYSVGTAFRFPKNVQGVTTEGYATIDGTNPGSDPDRLAITAYFSVLENFAIYGDPDSDNNVVVDTSGLTVTLKNTGAIQKVSTEGSNDGTVTALTPGCTITINNMQYVVGRGIETGDTGTTTFPVEKPRIYVECTGDDRAYVNALVHGDDWVGLTMRINAVDYTVSAFDYNGGLPYFTLDATVPAYNGTATVPVLPTLSNVSARLNIYHGFNPKELFRIEGLRIYGFAGNCININSRQRPTYYVGSEPNLNLSIIRSVTGERSKGSGICIYGSNTQPIQIDSPTLEYNNGAGIFEYGSSGVVVTSAHAAYNTQGSYSMLGYSANNLLLLPYTEGGMPGVLLGQYTTVIAPIFGSPVDHENSYNNVLRTYKQLTSDSGFVFQRNTGIINGTNNPKAVMFQAGTESFPNTIFGWGAGEEDWNVSRVGSADVVEWAAWLLGYNQLRQGWYNLYFGGNYATDQLNSALAFSGSEADEGGGKLWMRNGFYVGAVDENERRFWGFVKSIPTSGTVELGDTFWNCGAGVGKTAPVGWIVTTAGDIGSTAVLTPFGASQGNRRSGTVTLSGGTVTVSDTAITANSRIIITAQFNASGRLYEDKTARVAGTSFVLKSSNAGDAGDVVYEVIEP